MIHVAPLSIFGIFFFRVFYPLTFPRSNKNFQIQLLLFFSFFFPLLDSAISIKGGFGIVGSGSEWKAALRYREQMFKPPPPPSIRPPPRKLSWVGPSRNWGRSAWGGGERAWWTQSRLLYSLRPSMDSSLVTIALPCILICLSLYQSLEILTQNLSTKKWILGNLGFDL
jgi:hypothetical protein